MIQNFSRFSWHYLCFFFSPAIHPSWGAAAWASPRPGWVLYSAHAALLWSWCSPRGPWLHVLLHLSLRRVRFVNCVHQWSRGVNLASIQPREGKPAVMKPSVQLIKGGGWSQTRGHIIFIIFWMVDHLRPSEGWRLQEMWTYDLKKYINVMYPGDT